MYDRETVELALMALDEGMTHAEAAELRGAPRRCRQDVLLRRMLMRGSAAENATMISAVRGLSRPCA